jgi:4-diphosphocytidyl-2-C-methyl-D-erythritol kinase
MTCWRFFVFMTLEKKSPCKVNLLLNILGRRPDGFHELETVMHPVNLCDTLTFARIGNGIALSCSDPALPADATNLVYRAAAAFRERAKISEGVSIHLEKKIPMAAGLGGGSSNAATTLMALNELFGLPLTGDQLHEIAASLGSDIPFFLQSQPALATGRGDRIQALDAFPAMRGAAFVLIHPGFGISTPWAYQQLARFPAALNGKPGRAVALIKALQATDLRSASREFYNSLEAPALYKFPMLGIIQEFLRTNGAVAALMSGSGSTTFGLAESAATAQDLQAKVREKFGPVWTATVAV